MGKKATGDGSTAKTHNNKANSGRAMMMQVDPDIIYFTHSRIRPVFTGCNKRIQDTIDEIKSGATKVTDIPYITIIENFEAVYVQEPTTGKGGKAQNNKGQNKRSNRKNDDGSDAEDENMFRDTGKGGKKGSSAAPATTMQSFYFSLNNRRLYLFKTLKAMGLVDKITVYVKPALEREKLRYTRQRCALMAKTMTSKELAEAGEEEPDNEREGGDDRDNKKPQPRPDDNTATTQPSPDDQTVKSTEPVTTTITKSHAKLEEQEEEGSD